MHIISTYYWVGTCRSKNNSKVPISEIIIRIKIWKSCNFKKFNVICVTIFIYSYLRLPQSCTARQNEVFEILKKKVLRDDENSGVAPASKKMKAEFKHFTQIFSEFFLVKMRHQILWTKNVDAGGEKLNLNKNTVLVPMSRINLCFRRHDTMNTAKPVGELLKLYWSLKRVKQVWLITSTTHRKSLA